jgi:phospho-N-acetylmuramoyl-pentapeptide-transferase
MLYAIYNTFDINILQYITVRAFAGFFISLSLTLYLMPKFIRWSKNRNSSQPIYDLAPKTHKDKSNTPTMGGIVFLFATVIATLFSAKLNNIYVVGALLVIFFFGFIGYRDDINKIKGECNSAGLSAKMKFLFQVVFGVAISIILFTSDLSTNLYVPFYKYHIMELGVLSIFFWTLVIVATSNSVNLTDGLDGLATFPSFLAILTMSVIAYSSGNAIISEYLLIPKVSGAGELTVVGLSLAGSLIGFLWYNAYPAEIFMGDSGSLTLGAFLGYISIVSKSEILLILVGIIFVIESVSVIAQVISFRYAKKRIFLMAPIHHHFEIKGWSETKIIVRFWMIALIANIVALITLKLR